MCNLQICYILYYKDIVFRVPAYFCCIEIHERNDEAISSLKIQIFNVTDMPLDIWGPCYICCLKMGLLYFSLIQLIVDNTIQ